MYILIYTLSTSLEQRIDTFLIQNQQNFDVLTKAVIASNSNTKVWNLFSYDTIFTVITTSLVIVVIELLKWLIRVIDKRKAKKELKKFINIKLEELIDYIHQLEGSYFESANKVNVNVGILILPIQISKADFKILLNLDSRELYKTYNDKISIFKVFGFLDNIYSAINAYELYHDKMVIEISKTKEELRSLSISLINLLMEVKNEMILNSEFNKTMDEYKYIVERIEFYRKTLKKDNLKDFNDFFMPLANYIESKNLIVFLSSANDLLKTFNRFNTLLKITELMIKDYSNQLVHTVNLLQTERVKISQINLER